MVSDRNMSYKKKYIVYVDSEKRISTVLIIVRMFELRVFRSQYCLIHFDDYILLYYLFKFAIRVQLVYGR